MIYDLPKIEEEQVSKAHKERLYRIERDRLKTRYFVYLNYPVTNYHGLNVSDAKEYVVDEKVVALMTFENPAYVATTEAATTAAQ